MTEIANEDRLVEKYHRRYDASCCDTSIIIRLITGDDAAKQARASALFEQVEQRILSWPPRTPLLRMPSLF
jgi:hypothetical protein